MAESSLTRSSLDRTQAGRAVDPSRKMNVDTDAAWLQFAVLHRQIFALKWLEPNIWSSPMAETAKTISAVEIRTAKTRRLQMQHLNTIEGNALDNADIAMFEMFEREGWSHERRRAYILAKSTDAVSAAE
jgi:hypothetical protein